MGPEAWKQALGDSAWNRIAKAAGSDHVAANVLTAASEAGFTAPRGKAPVFVEGGTRVLWPLPGGGTLAGLTAGGLARHYADKGHGFFLFRMRALVDACAGPLLPRLQEILMSYEEQCAIREEDPLPSWANRRVFVGATDGRTFVGDGLAIDHLVDGLCAESPSPVAPARASAPGPGAS